MQTSLYLGHQILVRTPNSSLQNVPDIASVPTDSRKRHIIRRHVRRLIFVRNGTRTSLRLLCIQKLLFYINISLVLYVTPSVQIRTTLYEIGVLTDEVVHHFRKVPTCWISGRKLPIHASKNNRRFIRVDKSCVKGL